MKSPKYENEYDYKFYILEELKMEVPDIEDPHSDCNVNNEIVSEDTELSKFNVENKIKHEDMENGLPLNITIKTERIVEGELLDNNKNMSVPYELNVQDVQLNSDERLLKDNVDLLKPKNEQTNMARVEELNELPKCKHCDLYFDHRVDMLVHISLIHNNKIFKCELCEKKLTTLSNLKRHIKLVHNHKEPPKVAKIIFKCINCKAEFNNRLNLIDHAKLCQKEEEIISCKSDPKGEHNLRDHVNRIHFDYGTTFDCSCGKKFRLPLHLYRHKRRQHERKIKDDNGRFQCDSCQKIFKSKEGVYRHIMRAHYDYGRTFDCWCGKQFRSPLHLNSHKRQHKHKVNDTDNGRFQCDSCQKIFNSKDGLYRHIMRAHYDYGRTFDCWCGKQYRSPLHLNCHKRQHEHKINDRFQCDNCQKILKSKDGLVKHIMRVHYDYGRTFDCWCGKQFRSPLYLNCHKRQHEHKINNKFQCDSCQKFFKYKKYLVIHIMKVHYDYGRTFDCWCGKQYRSPLHLTRHKWQHARTIKDANNGMFQCDSCQKIFKSKDGLVEHMKSLHYDYGRTFDCSCGKQFRSPRYLRRHKWKQHALTNNGSSSVTAAKGLL